MDDHQKRIERLHVYILALVVSVFILILLIVSQATVLQNQLSPQTGQEKIMKRGALILQTGGNKRRAPLTQNLVVDVLASSDKEDVVAFDTMMGYDQDAFDLVSVSSLLPSFSVSRHDQDGYVSVTAYQPPEVDARVVMKDTPVLRYVFSPKKAGFYTFSILSTSEKEKTQLVTTKTDRLFPEVSELTVEMY